MANNTILLIDYEPRSIERFRDPLVAAGFSVEIATDGISGIEAFHRLSPDMVLVEAMIPKKHGFEVCQELKRTPHGRRTPVIITTGVYKGRKYRTQALHVYGCDEYIEKPIAPEQLLEIVGRFLTLGGSASSASDAKSAPPKSQVEDRPIVVERVDAIAKTGPSAAMDDGEEEITARLDALLSVGGGAIPVFAAAKEVPAVAVIEQDFFAQMKAELDAELDEISTQLPFETAPELEPIVEALASDQVVSPSVLEALPLPVTEPGPVVDVRPKRARKGKQAEKQSTMRPAQAAEVAPAIPATPPARAREMTVPLGTIVDSELESSVPRRRMPVRAWAAVAVVAVVGIYFMFPHGNSIPSTSKTPMAPPTRTVAIAPPVEARPPVVSAPSEALPRIAEPSRAVPGKPNPVLVTAKIPTPKKRSDPVRATSVAPVVITETTNTEPARPEPVAAPSAPETTVAGVEAVPDSAAAPAVTTIAPGTLIPIDVADTMPVSLKRKAPVYSAEAKQLRLSGTVTMNVLVNDRGTVDQVVLVSGIPGADVNDAAMAAAKAWTYRPATKNGVPVKVWRSEQVAVKP